jgi:hypothetical protein
MYLIYDTEFKLYLHGVVHEECIWTDEKSEALVVTSEQEKYELYQFMPFGMDKIVYEEV